MFFNSVIHWNHMIIINKPIMIASSLFLNNVF